MTAFDLVIRGGTVVTASDSARCDVGIRGGKITALAERISDGERTIDATGRLVLPGGIDAHCHLDQPRAAGLASGGAVMADDFRSGSLSAAFGGTTTIIPFAVQHRGQSLREAVADYHRRAAGKAYIDYAFHLVVSDPTATVLGQELPALVEGGCTSLKVYMTYEAMRLSDGQILEVLAAARRLGALVMVHAENFECLTWLTRKTGSGRQDRASLPRRVAPTADRTGGYPSRHHVVGNRRNAYSDCPRIGLGSGRGDSPRQVAGFEHSRGDLSTVPRAHCRRSRQARLRRS